MRKRNVFCAYCPRAVCEICAVKWVSEYGADAFTGENGISVHMPRLMASLGLLF